MRKQWFVILLGFFTVSCVAARDTIIVVPTSDDVPTLTLTSAFQAPTVQPTINIRPTNVGVIFSTVTVTSAETPVPVTPTWLPSPTPTQTPITTLKGPLIAFRVQDEDQFLIELFDLDSLTYREVRNDLVDYPLELQWFDNGCQLFIRGRLVDLHGEVLWEVPHREQIEQVAGNFSGTRLSPDKRWLVIPLYSGASTFDSAEFVNLEVIDLDNPGYSVSLTKNGGGHGEASWSSDGQWIAFADYDEVGTAQLYKASSDGQTIIQLTSHEASAQAIYSIVWSPNNQSVAYAVRNLSGIEKDSEQLAAWIGIINADGLKQLTIQPPQFYIADRIWWSADGDRIVFTGEGSPEMNPQIHWADAATGSLLNSFHSEDAPNGWFSNPQAVTDIDTIYFVSKDGYYLLNAKDNSFEWLTDLEPGGMWLDMIGSPFAFTGEVACSGLSDAN